MSTIAECLQESCTPSTSNELLESCTPSFQTIEENTPNMIYKPTADKSIQVIFTHKYRSKAIQTHVKTINQAISPLKPSMTSSTTSPFKVTTCKKSRPSSCMLKKITRNIPIPEEQSDSDISLYTPSVPSSNTSSPSVHALQVKSSSDCSDFIAEDRKIEAAETLLRTISKIEKQPRTYIGVPKNCYFLIDIIY
ncbi:hypothetical protein SFRURICE_007787 [Spodoptera frugiperda]|nr:hypothetical protein SFRURICE_007787 [Spodoptera frugiperda]